jgi:hypothetical protein
MSPESAGPDWNLARTSELTVATFPNFDMVEYSAAVREFFFPPETRNGVEVLFIKVADGMDCRLTSLIVVA